MHTPRQVLRANKSEQRTHHSPYRASDGLLRTPNHHRTNLQ